VCANEENLAEGESIPSLASLSRGGGVASPREVLDLEVGKLRVRLKESRHDILRIWVQKGAGGTVPELIFQEGRKKKRPDAGGSEKKKSRLQTETPLRGKR